MQDVMLLLKRSIFENETRDVQGILALDLAKAFDKVAHEHILNEIFSLNLGQKFFNFTLSILSERKAFLQLGPISGGPYELSNCRTPQGSLLSPLLFNIAMHKLSDRLAELPKIGHAIYADKITMWSPGGSLADLEQSVQAATGVTEEFLTCTGLNLSPTKSELLLYRVQAER